MKQFPCRAGPSRHELVCLLAAALLAACGGGGGGETATGNPPASAASQNPVVTPAQPGQNPVVTPAQPVLTAATVQATVGPTGDMAPQWNRQSSLSVTMKDASGKPIASPTCTSADPTKATVTADCTTVIVKRVGNFDIVVAGGGSSATLTLQGMPQPTWAGQRGSGQSNGDDDSFVVQADGTVLAWGYNLRGVLGQNADTSVLRKLGVPRPVLGSNGKDALGAIVSASAGAETVLAVSSDGKVWGWGSNTMYQLAKISNNNNELLPVRIRNEINNGDLDHIVQAEAGDTNAAALRDDGRVLSWSYYHGQGDLDRKTVPGFVKTPDGSANLGNIVAIAVGSNFSTALSGDGHVYAWGFDLSQGTLGAGRTFNEPQPLPFFVQKQDGSALDKIVSISSGYNFTLALAEDGTVWAWGENSIGQLGQGSSRPSAVPYAVQVKAPGGAQGALANIVMVAAGGRHSIALDASGRVWVWGFNQSGELGDGPNKSAGDLATLPRAVVDETASRQLGGVVSVAATNKTSLAVKADGTLLAWGNNASQDLGRGNINPPGSTAVPAPVRNMSDDGALKLLSLAAYPNLTRRAR